MYKSWVYSTLIAWVPFSQHIQKDHGFFFSLVTSILKTRFWWVQRSFFIIIGISLHWIYRSLNPFYICYYSNLLVSSLFGNFVANIILFDFERCWTQCFLFSSHRTWVFSLCLLIFYRFLSVRIGDCVSFSCSLSFSLPFFSFSLCISNVYL